MFVPLVSSLRRAVLLALVATGSAAQALELPLPPSGEDVIGQVHMYVSRYEDTFAAIAEAHDLGYLELVAANPGVDPWLPGEGTEVILPTRYILPPGPREGIVINLAEYRLYYYPKGRDVVYTYPLGIGREGWSSPVTQTRITAKTPNPAWYPPRSIREEHAAEGDPLPAVVPPGPDNPLGPLKMNLALPGYLIHGSNKKFGIGMRVSHGCFRMLNHNVLELAELAPVGTPVRIINQPYKVGVGGGHYFVEVHAPLEDDGKVSVVDKHASLMSMLMARGDLAAQQLDWEMLRDVVAAEDGLPVEIARQPSPLSQAETSRVADTGQ